jgi:hypothetical protein
MDAEGEWSRAAGDAIDALAQSGAGVRGSIQSIRRACEGGRPSESVSRQLADRLAGLARLAGLLERAGEQVAELAGRGDSRRLLAFCRFLKDQLDAEASSAGDLLRSIRG